MTEKLFDGNMMEKEIEEKKRNLKENYREIRENIAAAAKASGRKPEDITLLAATKTVPAEVINYGISLGIDYLGENKVQEFLSKYDEYDKKRCHLQFIGHLLIWNTKKENEGWKHPNGHYHRSKKGGGELVACRKLG